MTVGLWLDVGSRKVLCFVGACLLSCVLVGCQSGGEPGSKADDVGLELDSGSVSPDAGAVDTGSNKVDSGSADVDSGVADAGSEVDCGPVVADSSGNEQLLKPGCYVVGIDGFRVWAMDGALEEAIWVKIVRVDYPTDANPLSEELTHVGSAYKVTSRKPMRFDDKPLVFELPRVDDTDESELAVTVLIPAELIDHAMNDKDVWEPIDGYISDDEERLMIGIYDISEDGVTVALVHGASFSGD